jgi:hypothetical protein
VSGTSATAVREAPNPFVRTAKTLSVMPTFTCPAACTDCGTLSSPRERTSLSLPAVFAAIEEARELGFYNVVFTGGEATLRWRELLAAIEHATRLGLPTRVVTNAHWARTLERARTKLGELRDAGLVEINYSTGDEHIRFIPLDHVANAIVAALEIVLPVHVMVELRETRAITRDTVLGHPLIAALPDSERESVRVIESPWMPLDPYRRNDYPIGATATRENVGLRTGCESVLQTYTVQADGRIGACCGLGLRQIGELNVATVDEPDTLATAIARAEADFLKLWIHYVGPEKILSWAASHDPDIGWEGAYAHHCQACARIYRDPAVRRVIRDHYEEMVSSVFAAAWLDDRAATALAGSAVGSA